MFQKFLTILAIIATIFTYADIAKAQVVKDGLVSYWSFDKADTAGKTAKDIWGNNDGIIEGSAKVTDGKIGEALEFAGKDGYVDCGDDKSISNFSKAYSIEAWAYFAVASNYPGIFQRGDKTTSSQIEIYLQPAANLTTVHNRDAIYYVYWNPVPLEQWVHIAVVWEKEEWTVYYDGVKQDKTGGGGAPADPNTGKTCYIGLGYTDHSMNGIIDEVNIYDRALTEAEIQKNFKATSNNLAVESVNKLANTWGQIKNHK